MRSFMYLLILEVSYLFRASNAFLVLVIRRESDVKPSLSLVGGGFDIIVLAFDV